MHNLALLQQCKLLGFAANVASHRASSQISVIVVALCDVMHFSFEPVITVNLFCTIVIATIRITMFRSSLVLAALPGLLSFTS